MRPIQSMRVVAVVLVTRRCSRRGAASRARRHRHAAERPARRNAARGRRSAGSPAATSCSGAAAADFLQGGPGRDAIDGGPGSRPRRGLVRRRAGHRPLRRRRSTSSTPTRPTRSRATASSSAAGSRAIPYRDPDAQHETEVEPDSFTFGRTTVATFQVGRRFEGASTNIGFAVTTNDGLTWRSGLLPGLTAASVPAGRERARERSRRRIRRTARHLAHLDARARGRRRAARRQPLARRVDLEQRGQRSRGDRRWRRRGRRLRQELGRVRQHARSSPFFGRCYLVYTHSAASRHARGALVGRRRRRPGLRGSIFGARPAVGAFPVDPADGRARRRLPVGAEPGSRSPPRGRRTAERPGRRPSVSPTSTRRAASAGSAPSRCRRPTSTPAGGSGSPGTTAPHPARPTNSVFVVDVAGRQRVEHPRSGDARTQRPPACDRHRPPRRVASRSRTCGRVRGIDVELVESQRGGGWGAPRRLSAQTMPLAWMPNDDLRTHARRLHLRALRRRPPARRLGARERARRVELPAGRVCDARLEPYRVPDGLVLEERLDLPGLGASADERTTRLTFSAAERSSSVVAPSMPVRSIAFTSMWPASHGASSSREARQDVDRRRPESRTSRAPRRARPPRPDAPPTQRRRRRCRRRARAASARRARGAAAPAGARIATTPVGSGTVKSKYGPATGFDAARGPVRACPSSPRTRPFDRSRPRPRRARCTRPRGRSARASIISASR